MLQQSAPEALHPMEGTQAGAAHEELQPVRRSHVVESCGELSPMGRTPEWSRRRV